MRAVAWTIMTVLMLGGASGDAAPGSAGGPQSGSVPRPIPAPAVQAPAVQAPAETASAVTGPAHRASAVAATWRWPIRPRPAVMRLFDLTNGPYGRGHRGIDLAATPGTPVYAVASGRVVHVGRINGRGTVSVLHDNGIRSTYEPVEAQVARDQPVAAGTAIGEISGDPVHCAPQACLHLGARRERVYLDPLALLGAAGVRLLPEAP